MINKQQEQIELTPIRNQNLKSRLIYSWGGFTNRNSSIISSTEPDEYTGSYILNYTVESKG
jgi:hypothetical protein